MNKINSYVWKDARLTHNRDEKQIETRLVDMDEDQLQMIYTHAKEMLYNTDPKNPGRMIIIDQIAKQLDCCRAELALRWFTSLQDSNGNYIYTSDTLMNELRNCVPEKNEELYTLKDLFEVPAEFRDVNIKLLQDACRDALGSFNHSKITYSFIYNDMGLYLTQEELREIDNDLKEHGLNPEAYTLQAKINNHVKLPLSIVNADVKINPKGLTESEFMDMIHMKKYKGYKVCKYSTLSSSQLRTLLTKVLFGLEFKIKKQVWQWKEIMSHIEEVARFKHYKLS